MRRRLYRGVVKRACDDPGCDREWPCERHGYPLDEDDRWTQARLMLHNQSAPIIAGQKTIDHGCTSCGYVVCACVEEEPKPEQFSREASFTGAAGDVFRCAAEDSVAESTLLERVRAYYAANGIRTDVMRATSAWGGAFVDVRFEDRTCCMLETPLLEGWERAQKAEPVTANDVRVYCKDVLGSTAYVARDIDNPGCWVVELVPEFKRVDVAERQVRAWKALRGK